MQVGYEAPFAAEPGSEDPASGGRRRSNRSRVAGAALAVGVAVSLAAGGWGIFSSLGVEPSPARTGEPVEIPGGFVRVDAMTPEHMAAMQADKFAASGMNMSSMGMDMAPEGQRRFVVDVTLAAEDGAMSYSPDDFRLTGEGVEESGPLRETFEEGQAIPAGGAVSGSLVFQAPEDADGLELSFDGGRPVALDLPPATGEEGHGHDAPAKGHGDGGPREDGPDH
ncbi:DUF4352 domain-containing protein [Rubrobacter marinus]|nr:DUF4352 domain-containing protein [Rubrobacter marinus]